MLATRVDTFERELQDAMASEQAFRNNLHTVTQALETFFENHREEDMRLTSMIQEDSQRSREAKEEYDILAARLDDSIRPNHSTKRVELVKTISLYISIVLSVVFMAPIHAIVWLFESLIYRLGYRRMDEAYRPDNIYVDGSTRHRTRQHPGRIGVSSQYPTSPQVVSRVSSPGVRQRSRPRPAPRETGVPRSSAVGVPTHDMETDGATGEMQADIPEVRPGKDTVRTQLPTVETEASIEINEESDSTRGHDGERLEASIQDPVLESESSSSDSEDVFLDAKGEAETPVVKKAEASSVKGQVRKHSDENSGTRIGASGRPDWAEPFNSEETLPELSSFPSADFWNISEDDIRLDFVRHESDNHSPTSRFR